MFRPASLPVGELKPEPQELIEAPEPEALIEAPEPTPILAAPRRSRAKAVWITLLILLLLGAVAVGGWYYWNHRPASQPTPAYASSETPAATPISFTLAPDVADPVLKEIQAKINGAFTSIGVDKDATNKAKLIRYHYQADAYDIIATTPDALGVIPRTTSTFSASDAAAAVTESTTILAAHKYAKVTVPTTVESGNEYMTNGSRICELSFGENKSPGTISCANFSDIDMQAAKDRLFYQALKDKKAEKGVTSLYLNAIVDSRTTGYQLATVGLGNSQGASAGLFYAKTGGPWTFFISTQSELACSKYLVDADVRAAYKGATCMDDNNNESVVN